MKGLRRASVTTALLSLALTMTAFAGRADAALTTISCGQNVTTDVVLAADVGPCPADGFTVIGAKNVTIDLNGHRILGPDNLTPVRGIFVFASERVTVRNGTVSGFATGIEVGLSPYSLITGMEFSGNRGGLTQDGGGTGHNGAGISLRHATDVQVRGNRVLGNGPGAGILIFSSGEVLVEGNLIQGNQVRTLSSDVRPGVVHQQTRGIWVDGGNIPDRPPSPLIRRNNNIVRNNQILDNGWHGISVTGLTTGNHIYGNQVSRNGLDQPLDYRIVRYGDGIFIAALRNRVEQNVISGNGGNGILVEVRQNEFRNNRSFFNSKRPSAAPTFDLNNIVFDCEGNLWTGNVAQTFSHPCTVA